MSSSSSADRVNRPLARSMRRATSVGGPTIPRATTPRSPTSSMADAIESVVSRSFGA